MPDQSQPYGFGRFSTTQLFTVNDFIRLILLLHCFGFCALSRCVGFCVVAQVFQTPKVTEFD